MSLLDQAVADTLWLGSAMQTIHCIDGVDRRVFSSGSGPTVVMVPVLDSLNFLYAPQIRSLQIARRVITYEPVLSLSAAYQLDARVAELHAILKTFQSAEVDVVGWSDGGVIAYHFASRFPSMTRSLTLLAVPKRFRRSLRLGATLVRHLPIERMPLLLLVQLSLATLSSGPTMKMKWILGYLRKIPDFAQIFRRGIVPLLLTHFVERGAVSRRTVVMVGDRDRVVSAADCRELSSALAPTAKVIVIPGGEHFLTYANAGAVNSHLTTFLSAR